jgi:hypothetical protein
VLKYCDEVTVATMLTVWPTVGVPGVKVMSTDDGVSAGVEAVEG